MSRFPAVHSRLPRPRTRCGLTLAEMLTVAFLMAVVFSLVAQVLVPSLYLFKIQSARSDVQQGSLLVAHYVQKAMNNATVESLTFTTNPTAASWQEVREGDPYDPARLTPRFQSCFYILWHEAPTGRVWIKTWPPAPPDPSVFTPSYDFASSAREPLCLRPEDLRMLCGIRGPGDRVLARDVVSIQFLDASGAPPVHGRFMLPFRLDVACETKSSRPNAREDQTERFDLSLQLSPRCSRW